MTLLLGFVTYTFITHTLSLFCFIVFYCIYCIYNIIFYFYKKKEKKKLYSDLIHSFDWKSAVEHDGGV